MPLASRIPSVLRAFTLAVAVLMGGAASAATITVNTLDDELNTDGDCSLREAVRAANTDLKVDACIAGTKGADNIVFEAVLASGDIVFTSAAISVTDSLAIDGTTTAATQIRVNGNLIYNLFEAIGDVLELRDMTLLRARSARGAAIYVADSAGVKVTNVSFFRNEATGTEATSGGGAIYNNGGRVEIVGSQLDTCTASGFLGSGGAVFNNGGRLIVTNSSFVQNEARRAGGAIEALGGTTTLTNTNFDQNRASTSPGNGGAFHISGNGSAVVRGGTVSRNTAASEGGGFWNNTGTMRIAQTTFTGNTAEGAEADNGGGALFNNGGRMEVDTTTVVGNAATGTAGSGGGLFNDGGVLIVTASEVSGNTALRAGGGVEDDDGTTILIMSTFDGNRVTTNANPGNGGGVHSGGGTVVVAGGMYTDNAAVEGGALWTSGDLVITSDEDDIPTAMRPASGIPEITETMISGNDATGADAEQGGGGIFSTAAGTVVIADAIIDSNTASGAAGSGGGLFSDGDVSISRGSVTNNTAVEGGGLWTSGTLTVNGGAGSADGIDADGNDRSDDDDDAIDGEREEFIVISGNKATGATAGAGGGGIYVATGGSASARYATIVNNTASGTSGSGGGLLVEDGASAVLVLSEITGNSANRAGGGIELFDNAATTGGAGGTSVIVRRSSVNDNQIRTANPGNGGGIHVGGAGVFTLDRSTVAGNEAREGGGVWVAAAGTADINNSTVSTNEATEEGGGVYDDGGADLSLASATVLNNTAGTTGGGLASNGATFSLANTVVAGNTAATGADCSGTFDSEDYNLIETVAGCTLTGDIANTITGVDPILGPLADNGGFTLTHVPTDASPVVDTGLSTFASDQRGLPRGGEAGNTGPDDIGSVELGSRPVAVDDPTVSAVLELRAVHPNPASGRATLAFSVAESGPARVELFNVLGQRVLTAFDNVATPGTEVSVPVDVARLAAGVYLVRLESAGAATTRRLTVVR